MLPVLTCYLAMAAVYFIPGSKNDKINYEKNEIERKPRHKNLKKIIKMKHKLQNSKNNKNNKNDIKDKKDKILYKPSLFQRVN